MWEKLHYAVLQELSQEELSDWSRASLNSVRPGPTGAELTDPNPADRASWG